MRERFWVWLTCFASRRARKYMPSSHFWHLAACIRKVRYKTIGACLIAIEEREKIAKKPLYAYKCNFCRGWHQTSSESK